MPAQKKFVPQWLFKNITKYNALLKSRPRDEILQADPPLRHDSICNYHSKSVVDPVQDKPINNDSHGVPNVVDEVHEDYVNDELLINNDESPDIMDNDNVVAGMEKFKELDDTTEV